MIKSLVSKLTLLGIRESYLTWRNIWGLIVHPYKTLRVIQIEEDYSQVFLLFVTPAVSLFFWAAVFVLAQLLFHPVGLVGQLVNIFFFLLLTAHCFVLTYLGYWVLFYLWVKRRVGKEIG